TELRPGEGRNSLAEGTSRELSQADLLDRIRGYAEASRAPNTWRAYQSDLRHFAAWCAEHGFEAFPATGAVVAAYLTDPTGQLSTSNLERRLYALSALHRAEGLDSPADSPEVHAVWSGIKRTHRTERRQKAPTRTKLITAMVAELGERR